jgi:hypothetical protein
MSKDDDHAKAVLDQGELYLRQADGSYRRDEPGRPDPALAEVTDAEIDRQIAEDPDAAPDLGDYDLREARVVRPALPASGSS